VLHNTRLHNIILLLSRRSHKSHSGAGEHNRDPKRRVLTRGQRKNKKKKISEKVTTSPPGRIRRRRHNPRPVFATNKICAHTLLLQPRERTCCSGRLVCRSVCTYTGAYNNNIIIIIIRFYIVCTLHYCQLRVCTATTFTRRSEERRE